MKVTFKFNEVHQTRRDVYLGGKKTKYNIRHFIRPTLYSVYSDNKEEATFISLQQAKEYVVDKLKEGN